MSPRYLRSRPWCAINLWKDKQKEPVLPPGDSFWRWDRQGVGMKYVNQLNETELTQLAQLLYEDVVVCLDVRQITEIAGQGILIADILLESPQDYALYTDVLHLSDFTYSCRYQKVFSKKEKGRIKAYQEHLMKRFGASYMEEMKKEGYGG